MTSAANKNRNEAGKGQPKHKENEYDYIDHAETPERSPYMKLDDRHRTKRHGERANISGRQHSSHGQIESEQSTSTGASSRTFIVISRRSCIICVIINVLILSAIIGGVLAYMYFGIGELLSSIVCMVF